MIEELITLYNRDLDRLKSEILLFNQEDSLWKTTGSIKNSAGNLCLHLVGNLNTYIGKNIGGIPYLRDRNAEFTTKDVPQKKLVQQVEETRNRILSSLEKMDKKRLEDIYPEEVLGYEMSNSYFLMHLLAHLSYHLGQINYIRRVLELKVDVNF